MTIQKQIQCIIVYVLTINEFKSPDFGQEHTICVRKLNPSLLHKIKTEIATVKISLKTFIRSTQSITSKKYQKDNRHKVQKK